MAKIWLTRERDLHTKTPMVGVWMKQKPAFNDGSNGKFWYCDCRGKGENIPTYMCKILFGIVPKEYQIITVDTSLCTTQIQTRKDCPLINVEFRVGMEW